jgi:hypothetical protein
VGGQAVIGNASERPLPHGSLPNMASAMMDYFVPLTFIKIEKRIENHIAKEIPTEVSFYGVRQPLTPQELFLKPEGQRAWKWEQIFTLPSVILAVDDKITFEGTPYRVMKKADFKEYGYVQYEIAQDYTEALR